MKVSLLQISVDENESVEQLHDRVLGLIDGCAGSDLIVLPELWHVGILHFSTIKNYAEKSNGALMSRFSEKAKQIKSYINCGSFIEIDNGKYYNTSMLFDRNGNDVGLYRKIHLYSGFGHEADTFTHGDKTVTVKTDFGVIGMGICYDTWFPEFCRKLMLQQGAEIFTFPVAWPAPSGMKYVTMSRSRAIENGSIMCSCNLAGPYGKQFLCGESHVVTPFGNMAAHASATEQEIVTVDVNVGDVSKVRRLMPFFRDLRMLESKTGDVVGVQEI